MTHTNPENLARYSALIRQNILTSYQGMFREAGGNLPYPFITPGSQQYADVLWDWDSWLTNVALRQVLLEGGDPQALRSWWEHPIKA